MSKNNSTVKNVRRNALEVIIQGLSLSDSEKLKLHEDLRSMRIADDNDPLVKFTMLQGLLAQYNGETAQKIVHERENIEDTVETIKEFLDRFFRGVLELRNRDLAELKKNIKLWNNEVIIGTQEMIVELRYEKECLDNNIKNEQEKFDKVKEEIYEAKKERDKIKNSCSNFIIGAIAVCIVAIFIGGFVNAIMWKDTSANNKKVEKVAALRSDLELEYQKLQKGLDNEPSLDKRLKMLDKMVDLEREINALR
jgi:hypothetical protein